MSVKDKLYYGSEYYQVTEEDEGEEFWNTVVFGQENHLPLPELRYWPKWP
jgi:hypothetical protein